MPPKGSKGRGTSRTGNTNEGTNGDQTITTTPKPKEPDSPTIPTDPVTPDDKKQGSDSDSELNEEDSFKILKKILLNQKLSEKKSDERFAKLSKTI